MAQITIFEAQNVTGFSLNSTYGAFHTQVSPMSFRLVEGEEYLVTWDNGAYTLTAFSFTGADGSSCVAVGNKMVSTGQNDGDLFAIVCDNTNDYLHFFSVEDKTEHYIGVYKAAGGDIVLKDHAGNDLDAIENTVEIRIPTTGGGIQSFVAGTRVEKTILLNFTEGDMEVTPRNGEVFSKVTIQKPDSLVPENIAKNEVVAGVIGTHEGGADVLLKGVNFFDYDGTLLYTYTLAEAKALTEMPPLPEQEDLVCQGWNHTLSDIQQATSDLDIGAMYITADDKTHIHIDLRDANYLNCYLTCEGRTSRPYATIEWGDGTTQKFSYIMDGQSGTSAPKHTYPSTGKYCIKISCETQYYLGGDSLQAGTTGIIFSNGPNAFSNNVIERVHLGKNAELGGGCLNYSSVKKISIPFGITSFNCNCLYGCYALKHFTVPNSIQAFENLFPKGMTSLRAFSFPPLNGNNGTIANYSLASAYLLERVVVPEGITTIGTYFCQNAYSLKKLILPSTVTSIESSFLIGVSHVTIFVPDDMVDTYKAMANVAGYANFVFPISEMPAD